VDGLRAPAEVQLIHKSNDKNVKAIISLRFAEGPVENEFLETLFEIFSTNTTEPQHISPPVLNMRWDYYYYVGTLTLPPCSNGVHWFVISNVSFATTEQLSKLAQVLFHIPLFFTKLIIYFFQ